MVKKILMKRTGIKWLTFYIISRDDALGVSDSRGYGKIKSIDLELNGKKVKLKWNRRMLP